MKNSWNKSLTLVVFIITLCAGVAVGLMVSKLPAFPHHDGSTRLVDDSSLAGQLGLSSEQSAQMRKIWEGVRDLSTGSYEEATKADRERESAIFSLIPPEKVEKYNEIKRAYAERCASLEGRRDVAFKKAVQDTKRILTPTQCEKYDEILAKRLGDQSGGSHYSSHNSAVMKPTPSQSL